MQMLACDQRIFFMNVKISLTCHDRLNPMQVFDVSIPPNGAWWLQQFFTHFAWMPSESWLIAKRSLLVMICKINQNIKALIFIRGCQIEGAWPTEKDGGSNFRHFSSKVSHFYKMNTWTLFLKIWTVIVNFLPISRLF